MRPRTPSAARFASDSARASSVPPPITLLREPPPLNEAAAGGMSRTLKLADLHESPGARRKEDVHRKFGDIYIVDEQTRKKRDQHSTVASSSATVQRTNPQKTRRASFCGDFWNTFFCGRFSSAADSPDGCVASGSIGMQQDGSNSSSGGSNNAMIRKRQSQLAERFSACTAEDVAEALDMAGGHGGRAAGILRRTQQERESQQQSTATVQLHAEVVKSGRTAVGVAEQAAQRVGQLKISTEAKRKEDTHNKFGDIYHLGYNV